MKILFLIFFVILTACSSLNKEESYKYLSYQCPKITLPSLHKLPIKSLSNDSSPDQVMKSYVASVKMLSDWQKASIRQVQSSF